MKNHNMEEMLQKPGNISQKEMSTYIQNRNTKNYEEFICGWGAAFVNIGFTFPINKVMFRQQLHGVRVCKAVGQLQKEGMRHLYRGSRSESQADRISQDFFCGAVLGATLSTIFYPVNVVKVKMQCKLSGDFDKCPNLSNV
ncbi:Hypothetical predicted protein [Mytilus galloprovincialis]|uniref:Uncharacterized protein n=1 Tax=Mytilus galloprovincialis TaxID=29158 RepID=A0A8B6CFM8_MYTGA|nr:Hypothetical predicted protein [Mytilus galloprovincialis]VDI03536.1 Hypothetical predicted protein [Mytilus galloprovincialis]